MLPMFVLLPKTKIRRYFQYFMLCMACSAITWPRQVCAQTEDNILVKEYILGVDGPTRKALMKQSLCYVDDISMVRLIKRWVYSASEKLYDRDRIEKNIELVTNYYNNRINKTKSVKKKGILLARKERYIRNRKQELRYGNLGMRLGLREVCFSPNLPQENRERFLKYLYSIGYFDAEVSYSIEKISAKQVRIVYNVVPNRAYSIASYRLDIDNPTIKELVAGHTQASFIKPGQVWQTAHLFREKTRIRNLLSQNGYFGIDDRAIQFNCQYDSDHATVDVAMTILDSATYPQRVVDDVIVHLHAATFVAKKDTKLNEQQVNGITFVLPDEPFSIKYLAYKIAVQPGRLYNHQHIIATQEQLDQSGLFKSVYILPVIENEKLVVKIYADPDKKFSYNIQPGCEIRGKSWSPTVKVTPKCKWPFGYLSRIELQGDWRLHDILRSSESEIMLSIKWLIPYYLWFWTDKINKRMSHYKPSTSFELLRNPSKNGISTNKSEARMCYSFQSLGGSFRTDLFPIKLSAIHAKNHSSRYEIYSSIVANTILMDTRGNNFMGYRRKFGIMWEGGGLYENLFRFCSGLPACYLKLDLDYADSFPIMLDAIVVWHTRFGVLLCKTTPPADQCQPYQAGGFGYVRGWKKYSLGPGACRDTVDGKKIEGGDLLLLSNLELRKKLSDHFEMACFLDIGNTFILGDTTSAPEGAFQWHTFYKTLGVSWGCGLRFNYRTVFVVCADISMQIHSPSGPMRSLRDRCDFDLAIGYPF